ncbi:type II toxin-antitoxin system VapC family toxin [Bosea sp. CCNWLW174]|uniref:type II toxin-antitoxin system VapC family toxin n=1 Tax=unclassified Bosea (in: a-proteobacteria) TaxID=2653178 RepID=UPI00301421B0
MSSVVLDASFIVKLLVDESGSRLAQAVLEGYEAAGSVFLAPSHALAEIGEVLCRKLRKGSIESVQFERALDSATRRVASNDLTSLLAVAAKIAIDHGVSVYDALYVALADQAGALMLTADRKLAEKLRPTPFAPLILCVDESGLIFYGEP